MKAPSIEAGAAVELVEGAIVELEENLRIAEGRNWRQTCVLLVAGHRITLRMIISASETRKGSLK